MVEGFRQTYVVDMELELCSCPAGQTGASCKHQAAVAKIYSCLSDKSREESRTVKTNIEK